MNESRRPCPTVSDPVNYVTEAKRPRYKAAFTKQQIAVMVGAGKIEPAVTPKNWVNAFLIVEEEKKRQRPIFEPKRLNELVVPPPLSYPSRLQRRWSWTEQSGFVATAGNKESTTGDLQGVYLGSLIGTNWKFPCCVPLHHQQT